MFTPAMYELPRVRNFLDHIITNSTSAGKAKRMELKGALEDCEMQRSARGGGEVEESTRREEWAGVWTMGQMGPMGRVRRMQKTKDQETAKVEEPEVLTLVCLCMYCNGCWPV